MTLPPDAEIKEQVDAKGLLCPEPVMLLHKAVKRVGADSMIKMIATDPSSERDVARFCEFLRHELVDFEKESADGELLFTYWIKTRPDEA